MTAPLPDIEDSGIAFKPRSSVFMPIDLQVYFCCPEKGQGNAATLAVTRKILSIAPEFNRLGMRNLWVYYSFAEATSETRVYGGPFLHDVPTEDAMNIVATKTSDDGFRRAGMHLARTAEKMKLRTLFMGGVSQNACVSRTAMGAMARGYDVVIVGDLCANNTRFKGDLADIVRDERMIKRGDRKSQEFMFGYKIAPHLAKSGITRPGRLAFTTAADLLHRLEQAQPRPKGANPGPC